MSDNAQMREALALVEYYKERTLTLSITVENLGDQVATLTAERDEARKMVHVINSARNGDVEQPIGRITEAAE